MLDFTNIDKYLSNSRLLVQLSVGHEFQENDLDQIQSKNGTFTLPTQFTKQSDTPSNTELDRHRTQERNP